MPSPIAATFERLKSRNQMAFMPFITAGDPDLATTARLIRELAGRGVDLIEVGFPYSDPIADGPVIQASYTRALQKGLQVPAIFETIGALQKESGAMLPPLVAMVSYAIIFRIGAESFLQKAQRAGFAGLIVPDLPADEAEELAAAARRQELDLIQLIAPTTPPDRAARILKLATGFVYCISVAGITGVRDGLPPELRDQLESLRRQTKVPLAVGFGISRPEQVGDLRGLAEGVIVGSALVRHVAAITEQNVPAAEALDKVGRLAADMVTATHGS